MERKLFPIKTTCKSWVWCIFSGHKICGPTGIEFYMEKNQLNKLPAYQGGGEMIRRVFEKTTYAGLPHKFEAGTPNVAGGIVLELPSIMNEVGFENIQNKN
jgi:cysteine desulfurase/selenocysteine lyase